MPIAKQGDRVVMVGRMPDDPDPIPVGTHGVVQQVVDANRPPHERQYVVDWDIDRSLLLLGSDPFRVIPSAAPSAPVRDADSGGVPQ